MENENTKSASSFGSGDRNVLICRCEEVTEEEILKAIRSGCHTVAAVKRMTRAGMGACQGRTCGRLIEQILIREKVMTPEEAAPDKSRFPVVSCEIRCLQGEADEDRL